MIYLFTHICIPTHTHTHTNTHTHTQSTCRYKHKHRHTCIQMCKTVDTTLWCMHKQSSLHAYCAYMLTHIITAGSHSYLYGILYIIFFLHRRVVINSFFTFSFQFENLMDDVSKTLIHNIFWYTFKYRYIICNVAISVSHLSETYYVAL